MDEKELEVTPEEAKAETEAQAEIKDEKLREDLAKELGIDPDDESELLDNIVAREKASRERLSKAVGQKIKYRDIAKKGIPAKKVEGEEPPAGDPPKPLTQEDVNRQVQETLDKRDLDSLNLPDEIKSEINDLAKLKGISVKEAASQPYIKDRIEKAKKEEELANATPTRKNKGTGVSSYDPSKPLDPANFDLNTEDGRKGWAEAKQARRDHLNKK